MVEWMLRPNGVNCVGASTSEEALDLLAKDKEFDGAIIDLMLHGSEMGGHLLAEIVLNMGIFPVIVITAAPYALERINLHEDIPVLPKPFSADDLREFFSDEH